MQSDADLNALFAEKVAGYAFSHMADVMDPTGSGEKAIYLNQATGHRATANQLNFTASMDAVLPYLEKMAGIEMHRGPKTWHVYVTDDGLLACQGRSFEDAEHSVWVGRDHSLPRACVLALLRAKGVAV